MHSGACAFSQSAGTKYGHKFRGCTLAVGEASRETVQRVHRASLHSSIQLARETLKTLAQSGISQSFACLPLLWWPAAPWAQAADVQEQ